MQGTHQPFVDRGALEHEGIEVLDYRQLGRGHAVADRGSMTMRCFCPQQVGQDLVGRALALQPGGYRLVEGSCHALEAERAHRLDHFMPLH